MDGGHGSYARPSPIHIWWFMAEPVFLELGNLSLAAGAVGAQVKVLLKQIDRLKAHVVLLKAENKQLLIELELKQRSD